MVQDVNLKKQIGKRIQECRKNAGLTQVKVSEVLHMRQPHYSRYENGVFEMNYLQLVTICKLFKVSADYILGLTEY